MLPETRSPGMPHRRPRLAAAVLACLLLPGVLPPAPAQDTGRSGSGATASAGSASHAQRAAVKRVGDAVGVLHAMDTDPGLVALLARARGVYIAPTYGRAALGVGAAGGSGVLMARRSDDSWGSPAFFNIGGLSIGLQAGAEGGPFVLLLMNKKAVDSFRNKNNFSLSADVGLTVLNYTRMARGSTDGDVIGWSANKGLFGNVATLVVNDVRFNGRLTAAFYGKAVTAQQAIDATEADPQSDALRKALGSPPAPADTGGK